MIQRFRPEKITAANAGICIFVMAFLLPIGAGWAQNATTETQAAEAAKEETTAYPAGLDDPSIGPEELRLRLIPLTVDQLGSLAAAWQDQARTATQTVVEKRLEIRASEGAKTEALLNELQAVLLERELIFEKFAAVVSSLEAKGGDPAQVQTLRNYLSAITAQEKTNLTLKEFNKGFMRWLTSQEGGVGIGFRILVIIAALFILFLVARIVRAWAQLAFNRMPNLSKLLSSFLTMIVYWLTIAFGLMIVLAALGVNITPLFALVGGASFIIAFAMQETLGNLAAGLMIMINRPFDEGDYVQIAGLGGTVRKVSIVSTTVTTPDNQVIVIPNSKVWGDVIINVTASDTRRVDLVFGISYGDSIEQAQKVLEEVVAQHPLVLNDPAPNIRVNELAASSVNFIVRPWTKTSDYWTVFWDLQRSVKEAFDSRGISIPFPQSDMHLHVVKSGKAEGPVLDSALTEENAERSRENGSYASGDYGADEPEEDGDDRD
jgi:small conductance mechanosensitive channel